MDVILEGKREYYSFNVNKRKKMEGISNKKGEDLNASWSNDTSGSCRQTKLLISQKKMTH